MKKQRPSGDQSKRKTASMQRDDQQKQKSRIAAKNRRKNENDQFDELVFLNPWIKSNPPNKSTVIRLSSSYIGLLRVLNQSTNGKCLANGHSGIENLSLEALDGFIIILSKRGQVIYVNEKVVTYLGYPQSELLGKSIYNFVLRKDWKIIAKKLNGPLPSPEDQNVSEPDVGEDDEICEVPEEELCVPLIENIFKKHQTVQFTVRVHCSLMTSNNLKSSNFRVMQFAGHIGNIGHFSGLVQRVWTPDVGDLPVNHDAFISHLSPDLKLLFCEGRIHRYMDTMAKDIVGRVVYPFYHPNDMFYFQKLHSKLLAKGQCLTEPYRWMNKDGGWVWLQSQNRMMYCNKTGRNYVLCVNYVLSAVENKGVVVGLNPPTSEKLIETKRKESEQDSYDARIFDPKVDTLAQDLKDFSLTENNRSALQHEVHYSHQVLEDRGVPEVLAVPAPLENLSSFSDFAQPTNEDDCIGEQLETTIENTLPEADMNSAYDAAKSIMNLDDMDMAFASPQLEHTFCISDFVEQTGIMELDSKVPHVDETPTDVYEAADGLIGNHIDTLLASQPLQQDITPAINGYHNFQLQTNVNEPSTVGMYLSDVSHLAVNQPVLVNGATGQQMADQSYIMANEVDMSLLGFDTSYLR